MKSIIKKSFPLLAALLLPLAACDDEPEVGSTLYDVEAENFDAKLDINETALPGNQASLEVIQTPVSLITPDDEITFSVKLTKPATTDVTVTVAESTDLAAAYDSDAEALPTGTLQISNATVTIKAGSLTSDLVKMKLAATDAVKNIKAKGVAAVTIASNSAGIATGSTLNAYYVVVNKTETNYKGQLANEIATMTQIPGSQITATVDGYDASELTDGDRSTEFWYWYPGAYDVIFDLGSKTSVRGLGFYSNSYTGYCPDVIEILTSDDGETWTSQTGGKVALKEWPANNRTLIPFVLYASIPCKYVKLKFYSCFWTSYGSDYDWPAASEVNLYN